MRDNDPSYLMKGVTTVVAFIALITTWALSGPLTAAVLAIGMLSLVLFAWLLFGRNSIGKLKQVWQQKRDDEKREDADNVINRILKTNLGAMGCPSPPTVCVDGDYGSKNWDAGYKVPSEYCAKEKHMQELATNVVEAAAARAQTRVLPDNCCTQPVICPLETTWRGSFKSCPTTYIKGPLVCDLYQRDPRAWVFDLNAAIQERATINGEIVSPYKHMQARQMYAQFIMNDVVNARAKFERPIENILEATCFQRKVNGVEPGEYSDGANAEIPPVY